ncbi:hypothetical protein GLOIN_2v1787008 [Rhizophagus irregularis DAOM 181602=DAOM 197198]|nr:hypothetical protein GLOIN_2v1787008 [Rhizophagus irregularis DAOM 181602=DAOM 197198]
MESDTSTAYISGVTISEKIQVTPETIRNHNHMPSEYHLECQIDMNQHQKLLSVSSSKCGHLGNIVNEVVVHPHKDIAIEMVCNYVQIQDNIVIEVYKWIVVAVDIADDVVVDVVGEVDVDVAVAVFKNNLHD